MKTKNKRKKIIKLSIIMLAFVAVCFDLATSGKLEVVEGTFRPVSEFDAISSATVDIGLVPSDFQLLNHPVSRNTEPTYAQIEEMVRKAIELQGGLKWVIQKGDKVMLKINLVESNSYPGDGENTDVRVVKALVKIIADSTENDVKIVVAEGTARSNDDPNAAGSVWDYSGYRDLLNDSHLTGIDFSLLNLNQNTSDLMKIDLERKGTSAPQGTEYRVHGEELKADVYIAVPVLKIHDTGITNALKLQIGTAPGCYYGYNKAAGTNLSPGIYHDIGHRRWTTEAIVDLSTIADIDFVVVDAVMCLESNKNLRGGGKQVRFNTIVAGADPVAVDHVCAKMMGLNPDDIAHITLAERIGLGTNNPKKIDVFGASIEDVKIKVDKNDDPNGRYGQSNRIWILSKAFDGSDITKEQFADEANFNPDSFDTDDWSEPIYFFDDRIDLYSYYNAKENIISYAFTYFDAPGDKTAELWLGRHEDIYVYVNGELAFSSKSTVSYGDRDIGEKVGNINIKQGENTLLVKTANTFGDYSFALNICDSRSGGNRVEGLKFYQDKSEIATSIPVAKQNNSLELVGFPNPAYDYTVIKFEIPRTAKTNVDIYDLYGKLIQNLENSYLSAGSHELTWNIGNETSPGYYVCVLKSGNFSKTVKILVK